MPETRKKKSVALYVDAADYDFVKKFLDRGGTTISQYVSETIQVYARLLEDAGYSEEKGISRETARMLHFDMIRSLLVCLSNRSGKLTLDDYERSNI